MCDCSICGRLGYLLIYPLRDEIEWISGEHDMAEYKFATERKVHKFCSRCGSSICMDMTGSWNSWAGDVVGMNVRMLDDFDIEVLNLHKKNGKDFEPGT
ncbi:hypothetical protein JX265_001119 [Neoarthrinium moseri]|uniref:CENP-V/GFA domain-containing protein n=1 Tax=Neoarthrinium moseri TaxID=1658444 RepID=A0A9P9WXL1_9PEZI|nr:uncharacterized protein JN550_004608 [Neoarthrinium moseri]KAI1843825.1 hypothetical protein JX266_010084 [Neoarthrinium moseri]KAI1871163.1 hypothetical protein JN550_004608 [Neoarthrinium moseri]KAI1880879.1 hypothetical protein JX265_001119 [Neoarthrinium moseri]